MDYIAALESTLGKKIDIEMLPLQRVDVPGTYAGVTDLVEQFHYKLGTQVAEGVANFVTWSRDHCRL
jgi:UDP-glucuronate 4-epimerase